MSSLLYSVHKHDETSVLVLLTACDVKMMAHCWCWLLPSTLVLYISSLNKFSLDMCIILLLASAHSKRSKCEVQFLLLCRVAWQSLGNMSQENAMSEFVSFLRKSCPLFAPYVQAHVAERQERERKQWVATVKLIVCMCFLYCLFDVSDVCYHIAKWCCVM